MDTHLSREEEEMAKQKQVQPIGPDYIAVAMRKMRRLETALNRAAAAVGEALMVYQDLVQMDFYAPTVATPKEPSNGVRKKPEQAQRQQKRGAEKQLQQESQDLQSETGAKDKPVVRFPSPNA